MPLRSRGGTPLCHMDDRLNLRWPEDEETLRRTSWNRRLPTRDLVIGGTMAWYNRSSTSERAARSWEALAE